MGGLNHHITLKFGWHFSSTAVDVPVKFQGDRTFLRIYIIIKKNIRYLLWNGRFWRSLNNTYPIFLTPCIRCTNNLCDSCDLTDVNQHFIPSRLRMIWNRWPIVTSSLQERAAINCDVTMLDCSRVVAMDAFLTQWCWGQLFNEFVKDTYVPSFFNIMEKICEAVKNTSCFNFFV